MGDFIKWALIAGAVVAGIALILTGAFIGEGFGSAITSIPSLLSQFISAVGGFLVQARNFINNFVLPGFEFLLTLAIGWLFIKPFFMWGITKGVKIFRSFMK